MSVSDGTAVSVVYMSKSLCGPISYKYNLFLVGWLVGWFTPPLPWDGDMVRTAIQVDAVNLIELG